MSEQETTLHKLVEVTSQILNLETVDPDAILGNVGIDSMNIVQLILSCEQIYENFNFEKVVLDETTTLRLLDGQLVSA